MADSFKQIGIIGKYADTTVSETLRALSDYLQTRDVEMLLDEVWFQLLGTLNCRMPVRCFPDYLKILLQGEQGFQPLPEQSVVFS